MPPEQIEQMPPSSGHKETLLSLLVLILVGVGGWGVYSYYAKEVLTPEEVLLVATKNAFEIDSSTLDVRVGVDLSETAKSDPKEAELFPGMELRNVVFNVKGSYDGHDLENPKYDLNMAVEADTLSISAAFKMVDKMGYLRLEKVPVVAEEMTRDFIDKWFSFSLEGEEFQEALGGLTEEDKKFLYDISANSKVLKITEVFPLEKINGDLSYHYSFTMDLVELKAYMIKIGEYANKTQSTEEGAELFDVNSFAEEFEAIKKIDGSVWVSKNDKYMNKMVLDIEVAPDPLKTEIVKTNLTATFGEFNKPFNVVAPTESTPFEEIFGNTLNTGKGDTLKTKQEEEIIALLSPVRLQAEYYYVENKDSYLGFCGTDEVKNASTAIKTVGGTEFVCKDKTQEWAVGAEMPNGVILCYDFEGFFNRTSFLPIGTVCPK